MTDAQSQEAAPERQEPGGRAQEPGGSGFRSETAAAVHELRRALDEATARFELGCRERPQVARKGGGTVEHRAAKLGRNDPCFCGSGRKFKKCCGKPQG